MRLLAKYLQAIPTDVRAYFRPFLYGVFGGLAAVGFQTGIKVLGELKDLPSYAVSKDRISRPFQPSAKLSLIEQTAGAVKGVLIRCFVKAFQQLDDLAI